MIFRRRAMAVDENEFAVERRKSIVDQDFFPVSGPPYPEAEYPAVLVLFGEALIRGYDSVEESPTTINGMIEVQALALGGNELSVERVAYRQVAKIPRQDTSHLSPSFPGVKSNRDGPSTTNSGFAHIS